MSLRSQRYVKVRGTGMEVMVGTGMFRYVCAFVAKLAA
jgi:hypothetical protein